MPTECTHNTEYDDGTCRCPACTDRAIDVAHSGPPQDEGDERDPREDAEDVGRDAWVESMNA